MHCKYIKIICKYFQLKYRIEVQICRFISIANDLYMYWSPFCSLAYTGVFALDEGSFHVYEGTNPLDEGFHVHDGTLPLDEGSFHVHDGTLPLDEGSFHVHEGTLPLDEGSFHVHERTLPPP